MKQVYSLILFAFGFGLLSADLQGQDYPLEMVIQNGHMAEVNDLSYSPDGKFMATASDDNTAKLWDVGTGKEIRTFVGHTDEVTSFAFSHDGKYIATAGLDSRMIVWEIITGHQKLNVKKGTGMYSIHFSHNDLWLIVGAQDNSTYLFDAISGNMIRAIGPDYNVQSWRYAHKSVAFSPDENYIAIGSDDYSVTIWDVNNGQPIKFLDYHKDKVKKVLFSPDGQLLASAGDDGMIILYSAKDWKMIRQINCKKILKNNFQVFTLTFSNDGKTIVSSHANGAIYFWNVDNGDYLGGYDLGMWTKALAYDPSGIYLTLGADQSIYLIDPESGDLIRNFSGLPSVVKSFDLDPKEERIAVGYFQSGISIWDLKTGKLQFSRPDPGLVKAVKFTPDGEGIISGGAYSHLIEIESSTGKLIKDFGDPTDISKISFSPDNGIMAAANFYDVTTKQKVPFKGAKLSGVGEFTKTGDFISIGDNSFEIIQNDGNVLRESLEWPPYCMTVDSRGKYFAFASEIIKIWDLKKESELMQLYLGEDNSDVVSLAFSPDNKFLACGTSKNNIHIWDLDSSLLIGLKKFEMIDLAPESLAGKAGLRADDCIIAVDDIPFFSEKDFLTYLALHPTCELLVFRDPDTLKLSIDNKDLEWIGIDDYSTWDALPQFITLNGHTSSVNDLHYSENGAYLYSGSDDGTIIVWDMKTRKEYIKFIRVGLNDYVTMTPEGYYSASKGAANGIHFVKGLDIYSFDSFDLIYNRPDIVLEKLGRVDQSLIDAYKRAYFKRLNRMGFTMEDISAERHMPEISFNSEDLPLESIDKQINVNITSTDSKYLLDRINVYVNDVPIFGTSGISLKEEQVQKVNKTIPIELSNGVNNIQFSTHNEKGVESLKKYSKVNYTGADSIPDIYFVGFGVSTFHDKRYNLNYASKDPGDILELMTNSGHLYNEITYINLTDENATRENFKGLESIFGEMKVDDQVIVFIASHGLLDKNLDYYIATYDTDFDNPSEKALKYDEIENLLDGIPARNKLILIDACHSGEVDKEDLQLVALDSKPVDGKVKFRGFSGVASKEQSLGLQNSFELMKGLFADLRLNNGAVVISSASGQEFAYEGDEWQNGLFTYSFLEGLKTKNADLDKDGQITVYEVQAYISERVSELSGGRQNPTNRVENLQNNFRIW